MSALFTILLLLVFAALVVIFVGFAAFVWLQVLAGLEERRNKLRRESRF
jgi:hypothetical protein